MVGSVCGVDMGSVWVSTEVGWVERGVLWWFEVEWGVVCEWDVPVSMLGKSLKVVVCLSVWGGLMAGKAGKWCLWLGTK